MVLINGFVLPLLLSVLVFRWYKQFKKEELTEDAFFKRIAIGIVIMILCVVILNLLFDM